MPMFKTVLRIALCSSLVLAAGCEDDDEPDDGNENEVITTVGVTFTPSGGGTAETFEFDDPDGDGGAAPTIDAIDLAAGNYTVTVSFENRLENPPEDITAEIMDEADEHQIFFTGSAVEGPATSNSGAPLTHTYDDEDANGLSIGLSNSITAAAGTGDLVVTLRHMPPVGGQAVKTATLASDVAGGGFAAIGGSNDVQVTFSVTVQ